MATTSALARKPCVRTHYVRTNNAKFSGHYVCHRTHNVCVHALRSDQFEDKVCTVSKKCINWIKLHIKLIQKKSCINCNEILYPIKQFFDGYPLRVKNKSKSSKFIQRPVKDTQLLTTGIYLRWCIYQISSILKKKTGNSWFVIASQRLTVKLEYILLSKRIFAATPKSADLLCSCATNQHILSNVRSGWLAMPLVAGFLEMFAGVLYNREEKNLHPPPTYKTICLQ